MSERREKFRSRESETSVSWDSTPRLAYCVQRLYTPIAGGFDAKLRRCPHRKAVLGSQFSVSEEFSGWSHKLAYEVYDNDGNTSYQRQRRGQSLAQPGKAG